jgi:hypothetical protein
MMAAGAMTQYTKKCDNCGFPFSVGKQWSVGIFILLLFFTLIGGIIYYALRHKERCPNCNSKNWHFTTPVEQMGIAQAQITASYAMQKQAEDTYRKGMNP